MPFMTAEISTILTERLRDAGLPVAGISMGRHDDRTTWRIDFIPGATQQQKADTRAIVDAFDPVKEDNDQRDRRERSNDLRKVLQKSVDKNRVVTVQDLFDLGVI